MDQVIELGLATTGLGSGRQWDVRVASTAVGARKSERSKPLGANGQRTSMQGGADVDEATRGVPPHEADVQKVAKFESWAKDDAPQREPSTNESLTDCDLPNSEGGGELKMVCRPKVGEKLARLAGGGFVAVWRRMRDMRSDGGGSGTSVSLTSPVTSSWKD